MTDGLLENIIQLEKRIQLAVATERARADEWQQRELDAIENTFAAAQESEDKRYQQRLAEKKSELQNESATMEASSSAWCQRLSKLDDSTLHDVLERYLAVILPGGDHDHPYGQS